MPLPRSSKDHGSESTAHLQPTESVELEPVNQAPIGALGTSPATEIQKVSNLRLAVILSSLWIGTLFVALDETMIATIAVTIASDLSAFSSFSWLTTAYLLGSSTSQVISGHLVDIFGRRKGLMVCFALFALGTLLCGLARNVAMFLIGRVFQGLGGGSVSSITAVVETDLIPMERRPFLEGFANVVYGVVLALGGVYGAAVTESIGWRWAFLIQVPIVVVDALVAFFTVKISDEHARSRTSLKHIDIVGMISLLGMLVLLEYGLNNGSVSLRWSMASVIAPLVVAGLCFTVFAIWEVKFAKTPVVPIREIVGRTVGNVQISAFMSTGVFTSALFYIAVYLETQGVSEIGAGLRLIPMAITFALGSSITGAIVSWTHRYYHINIALQLITMLGCGLLCTLTLTTPKWQPYVFLGILGLGVGGSFVTNLMGVLTSVPDEKQATVQATSWSVRAVGIIFSLTISSVIFQTVSRIELNSRIKDPQLVEQFQDSIAIYTSAYTTLDPPTKAKIADAYMTAVKMVFYFMLAQGGISVVSSLCMKNNYIKNEKED